MQQRISVPVRTIRLELWVLSAATILFASAALVVIIWNPKALALALICGGLAVASRSVFIRLRSAARTRAAASTAVATSGLVLATIVVVPLLLFAVLWLGLLAIIGIAWVLHLVGLA